MMRKFIAKPVLLITVLFVLSGSAAWGDEKETPVHGSVTLQFENEIVIEGSGSDSNGMLSNIKEMVVDSRENIYLLDWKQPGVLKFDSRGKFVKQIGQKGQGPSDITMGTALYSGAGEVLHVYDYGNSRMSRFTPKGEFIDAVKLKLSLFTDIYTGRSQAIFAWVTGYSQKETYKELVRFDKRGNREKSVEVFFREKLNAAAGVRGGVIHAYTAKVFMCPVDEACFAFGSNIEDMIRVLDTRNNKVRRFRLNRGKKESITSGELAFYKRRYPGRSIERLKFPPHRPFFKRIIFDEKRFYILRFKSVLDESKESVIDIFSFCGEYLYRVVSCFEPYLIRNGKMYVIDKNGEDETVIRKLSIKNLNECVKLKSNK